MMKYGIFSVIHLDLFSPNVLNISQIPFISCVKLFSLGGTMRISNFCFYGKRTD